MSESLARRHGLEPLLATPGGSRVAEPAVTVMVRGDLGHINLRGRVSDSGFLQMAGQELGQALPVEPNTFSVGEHRVCWLGPDEWLVVTPVTAAADIAERLEGALSPSHTAVNDVSGGQVALLLEGSGARELLARGCTLDLHPRVFRVGDCAQSLLGKAGVLIALVDDAPTFMVVVRRSFSDYLCRWLIHAGRERGIVFTAS
jgi:sarcosine oxidase subunit gamma